VTVERAHFPFEICKLLDCGLDDQQDLGLALDSSLPAINRFHFRKNLDAGGELSADEEIGETRGFFPVRRGQKNYNWIRAGHYCSSSSSSSSSSITPPVSGVVSPPKNAL